MENTSKAREMDQMIKEQNENANLDVKEAENDNMNKEKKLTRKLNRKGNEKITNKIEKTIETTTRIKQQDLENPLEKQNGSFYFRMHIAGHIESGNFYDGNAIFCKYDFVVGNDWDRENGQLSGQTQYACKGEGNYDYFVWNMPFECSFRSYNPFGWPQLVITCMAPDFWGRECIKGYGVVHVPTQPGRHERTVHIFSPITSSVVSKIIGIMVGQKAEFNDAPKVIASGEGREITRTKSEGTMKIVFQITLRDMDKFGYSIS